MPRNVVAWLNRLAWGFVVVVGCIWALNDSGGMFWWALSLVIVGFAALVLTGMSKEADGLWGVDEGEFIERVASVQHDAWVHWSTSLANAETLSKERLERWEKMWVDYEDLPEEVKELDREWAYRVLESFKEAH